MNTSRGLSAGEQRVGAPALGEHGLRGYLFGPHLLTGADAQEQVKASLPLTDAQMALWFPGWTCLCPLMTILPERLLRARCCAMPLVYML